MSCGEEGGGGVKVFPWRMTDFTVNPGVGVRVTEEQSSGAGGGTEKIGGVDIA